MVIVEQWLYLSISCVGLLSTMVIPQKFGPNTWVGYFGSTSSEDYEIAFCVVSLRRSFETKDGGGPPPRLPFLYPTHMFSRDNVQLDCLSVRSRDLVGTSS